jgi:hypothetical protein
MPASLSGVISLALLMGSVLLVLGMLLVLFGPLAAPARDD